MVDAASTGAGATSGLIDAEGRVARLWRKVPGRKVPGHAAKMLRSAAALG